MADYYLRLEAVNLANFVYDTADLSVIRGGSQMLSARQLTEHLGTLASSMTLLSSGASALLYRFVADSDEDARKIRQDLSIRLQGGALEHATFVADVCRANGDFRIAAEALISLNRHRQMQSPTLVYPNWQTEQVCEYDGVRPASHKVAKGKAGQDQDVAHVSESVFARYQFGRNQKRTLLKEAIEAAGLSVKASNDLTEIATGAPREFKHLENKMAVLSLDGNDFGKTQQKLCTTAEKQREFDEGLQAKAKSIAERLAREAAADPARWLNGSTLRAEMLMLAGDEVRLVVPAWCGWAALSAVFDEASKGTVMNQTLTYKAGLVFCNYHAPIQRMVKLAGALADFAKEYWSDFPDQNVFTYEVLESFDVLEAGSRVLPRAGRKDRVLLGSRMKEIGDLIQFARKTMPGGKLHRIVQLLSDGKQDEADGLIKTELIELAPADAERLRQRKALEGDMGWLHFLELADYAHN